MATPPQKLCAPDFKKESNEHKLHNLLMQACREGRLDRLKKLLKKENAATLITEYGQGGYAPIHCAAYNNHKPIIELLLSEDNRRVDHPSQHRETALHIACMRRHTELAKLLLQNGANPLAVTTHGNTPLHYAASTDCAELVEMLLHGILVETHIDEVNAAGQTAAEFAATLGCVNAVSVLRHHGANFQVKNRLGHTAVNMAEMLGNTRCHGIARGAEDPNPVLQHPRHNLLQREGFSSVSSLPATRGSDSPVADVRNFRSASAIAPRRQLHTSSATSTPTFAGSTEAPTPKKTRSGIFRRKKFTPEHSLSSHSTPSIPGPGKKRQTTTSESVKCEDSRAEDHNSKEPESQQ